MGTKVCTSCGLEKDYSEYYKQKGCRLGLRPYCKACIKSQNESCQKANPEPARLAKKRWVENNKEKHYENVSRWRKENPHKHRAKEAKRRAQKLNATPPWLTQDQMEDIAAFYELSGKFGKLFGVEYQVDHIVPLQGKNVCGLHVPWNLQVLERSLNRKKSNDMKVTGADLGGFINSVIST
jgi:hypothetical protein